jgi:outer membrane biogenesis lipoprotein LolB
LVLLEVYFDWVSHPAMKFLVLFLCALILAGCAVDTRPPVVPALAGKPRVEINRQPQPDSLRPSTGG